MLDFTFNEFLLAEDDFIAQRSLFVIFQNQEISSPHLVLLQESFTLHLHLHSQNMFRKKLVVREDNNVSLWEISFSIAQHVFGLGIRFFC